MSVRRISGLMLAFGTMVVLTGCMPKVTMEELKQMRPQRPVELDHLGAFVGTWESEATMTFAGMDEPITGKGHETMEWACDGWCLLGKGEYEMGDIGKMHTVSIWSYDAKADKYRMYMANDYGETESGMATYDPAEKEWDMWSKARTPHGHMANSGEITMVADGKMQWEFTARDAFWRFKIMEGSGISTKK
ncbi:MAG: DUF1579 family protein [Phycisphaerae bacterium]|nr:DUF1579 family protein [Phycisphaerae bacterium]